MKQTYYRMRCKLRKIGIGEGLCCFSCKNLERPKDSKSKKMCEHEEILETCYRDV